jgi:glutaredoxin 3
MSDVKIFTKPGCPYCAAARKDLEDRGVAFEEFDVTANASYAEQALSYSEGQRLVPIIITDGDVRIGFNGG